MHRIVEGWAVVKLSASQDVPYLLRCFSDVMGLSALPAMWVGADPQRIANDLADIVFRVAELDFLSLELHHSTEISLTRYLNPRDVELKDRIHTAIAGACGEGCEIGGRDGKVLRLCSRRMSALHGSELLILGAYRDDFPTDIETVLIRVAANQAETWLERRYAENALAAESAFRRGIENSMAAGVVAIDLQGRQTYVNAAFTEMFGWDAQSLLGTIAPFPYWAPEDERRLLSAAERIINEDIPAEGFELKFRGRDEKRLDVLLLASPLHTVSGVTAGYVWSVYDITARKWAEYSSAFLAGASEILSRTLDEGESLEALCRFVVADLGDWCWVDLLAPDGGFDRICVAHRHPDGAPFVRRLLRHLAPVEKPVGVSEAFVGGRSVLIEAVTDDLLRAAARDEDHLDVLRSIQLESLVCAPMSARSATFGVITLATTRPRPAFGRRELALAEELARRAGLSIDNDRLYSEAKEANRSKDEFLAKVSHELRTPMTAIRGWSRMLRDRGLTEEETQEAVESIGRSADAQGKLIDDLLDVSRVVTGKLTVEMTRVDLAQVVFTAVSIVRPAAMAKRQTIELSAHAPAIEILADQARLQQVFWNLLSNAVKFTPAEGRIDVAVQRNGEMASVFVKDSGSGIPPQLLPVVFERFRQGKSGAKLGGLGLGLSIAKDVVELHGGTIRAESSGEGLGSTFTVTLPLAAAD